MTSGAGNATGVMMHSVGCQSIKLHCKSLRLGGRHHPLIRVCLGAFAVSTNRGMGSYNSTTIISNSQVIRNDLDDENPGQPTKIVGSVGGILINDESNTSMVRVINSTISNNSIKRCTYDSCKAGGIAIFGARMYFDNCTLSGNYARRINGGIKGSQAGTWISNSRCVASRLCSDRNSSWLLCARFSNNQARSAFGEGTLGHGTVLTNTTILPAFAGKEYQLSIEGLLSGSAEPIMICPTGSELSLPDIEYHSYSCIACPPGRYSLGPSNWTGGPEGFVDRCTDCPSADVSQVNCEGGFQVVSQPGFDCWADTSRIAKCGPCPNKGACATEGNGTELQEAAERMQGHIAIHAADGSCAKGYRGRLCTTCDDDFFSRKLQQLQCFKCPQHPEVNIVVYWVNTIVLFGFALKAASDNAKNPLEGQDVPNTLDAHHRAKLEREHELLGGIFKGRLHHSTL